MLTKNETLIELDRKAFIKTVRFMKKAAAKKSSYSYELLRIFTENNVAYIAACDSGQIAKQKIAHISGEIDAFFSPDLALKFLSKLKDVTISISSDSCHSLIIDASVASFMFLPTIDEMWGLNDIELIKPVATIEVDPNVLSQTLSEVGFAMSNEETRYYLKGVYVHSDENDELSFVATDGHQLAKRVINVGYSEKRDASNQFASIIPRETILLVREALKDAQAPVVITISNLCAMFTIDELTLTANLIDGTYPDYMSVIPRDNHERIVIKKDDLDARVSLFTGRGVTYNRLEIHDRATENRVDLIQKDSKHGDVETHVQPVDVNRSNPKIDFQFNLNAQYLLNALNAIDDENIEFMLGANKMKPDGTGGDYDASPILIRGHDRNHDHDAIVIMPVR